MKCKELGKQDEYTLESNGKQITFLRKRLTTRAFNDLEQTRSKTDKEVSDDAMANAQRTAELYLKIAQAYLTNKETNQPISKEDYENCFWEEIKIVLDACHLRTMTGLPNVGAASKT